MLSNYLLIGVIGFLTSACFISVLRRFVFSSGILVARGIPQVGGIAIGIAFLATTLAGFLLCRVPLQGIRVLLWPCVAMLVFGIIDDVRELSVLSKFMVQIIAATLLMYFGVKTQIVYIGALTNAVITYLWVLGITNAFNHLDVLDGLAGGTAVIVSLAFFVICVLNRSISTGIVSLALAACTLAFLFYNLPPARIYMGNAGSHFLGFVLSAIAISISYAPMERKMALLTPLVILSLPILDTAFLIIIRSLKKNLPFNKSNDHPALRLLFLGYSKKKALYAMLALCLFFSASGVLVSQVTNPWGGLVIAVVAAVGLGVTCWVGRVRVSN